MGELRVQFSDDTVSFSDDGVIVGKLLKTSVHPDGLQLFVEQYNELLGSVKYQPWLRGAMAGLSMVFGPPIPARLDLEEVAQRRLVPDGDPGSLKTPETTEADTRGLTPLGSPENATTAAETIVPVSESPVVVGETIVPVFESPAVVSEETPGLTPPGSPEPGVVSP